MKIKKIVYFTVFATCLLFTGCDSPSIPSSDNTQVITGTKSTTIRIISWNLQTFFDGETVGTEYDDYKGSKTQWSEARYKDRLEKLCNFIEKSDVDIYIFQEIENAGILQDISNYLAGINATGRGYRYSSFAKEPTTALGIGIISRYPLQGASVHQLDLRSALDLPQTIGTDPIIDGTIINQPSLRPILQVDVLLDSDENTQNGKAPKRLALYICHWKSKYGGAEKSEVWRNAQEQLLADLLLNESSDFLVVGDFNRTIEEFLLDGSQKNTISSDKLRTQGNLSFQGTSQDVQIISAWLLFQNSNIKPGSYYYRESWESIDHFFYKPTLKVIDFQTLDTGFHVTERGFPLRYDIWSGAGVSDHLPLLSVLQI